MTKATEQDYQEALQRQKAAGVVRDEYTERSFRRGWCIPAGESKPKPVKKRAKKTARNISKNTTIIIPEHFIPSFKPAKSFVNKVKSNVKR